ncbi:hypothetical protein [Oceanirhabdus sp. W0125-5]|uniref:hypothetical protein n=1 Tax=Oceanirhabdus sp. W0125-5 TaxID=2999116 RepID=UPI0022F2C798|nr:hypothetical protein [Oceanirhabdus sp. W0125-5]WBW98576.1 hypothetical protein OW730_07415 [Oceanirhabdus sp. W0125-5]
MGISEFTEKLNLITLFVYTVNDDLLSTQIQKHLVKNYASNLRINLTDNMVGELIHKYP